jgi:hypothetical protein
MLTVSKRDEAARIGNIVANRRREAIPPPAHRDGLTIAVGTTSADGLRLDVETRLVKAAILYADSVILFSPAAAMLASAEQLGTLDDDQMMGFLRLAAPALGEGEVIAQACAEYERLRAKRRRSKEEIQQILGFQQLLRGATRDLAAASENLISQAGGDELSVAIAHGLVQVDPLVDAQPPPGVETNDDLAETYLDKLGSLLVDPHIYPLFDDSAGALVREGLAEGLFTVPAGAARRGTQAATAASFVERMPALPRASMSDIIDVRSGLDEPLSRFRRAIIQLARVVDATFPQADLDDAIRDVYAADVEPVLQEIAATFARDAYLRELMAVVTDDVHKIITEGAGLALGALGFAHLPAVAAASVGLTSAAASTAFKTGARVKGKRAEAEQNQLYLLYTAEKELQRRI